MSAASAGGVIAFYQLGYGIAAFGVGPLLDCGSAYPTIYAFAAAVAAVMGAWSFVVARSRPTPHPDLGHAGRSRSSHRDDDAAWDVSDRANQLSTLEGAR